MFLFYCQNLLSLYQVLSQSFRNYSWFPHTELRPGSLTLHKAPAAILFYADFFKVVLYASLNLAVILLFILRLKKHFSLCKHLPFHLLQVRIWQQFFTGHRSMHHVKRCTISKRVSLPCLSSDSSSRNASHWNFVKAFYEKF